MGEKKAAGLKFQALCSKIHVTLLLNQLFLLLFCKESYVSFLDLAERPQASPTNFEQGSSLLIYKQILQDVTEQAEPSQHTNLLELEVFSPNVESQF